MALNKHDSYQVGPLRGMKLSYLGRFMEFLNNAYNYSSLFFLQNLTQTRST